jgi:hypothetical protein
VPEVTEATSVKRLRLQRLMEALRRRDWLGLVFEVLVVTLGVLLAFEIEQWAQERQRAASERQFLERLYAEYGRAGEEMRRAIGNHDRIIGLHRRAYAARHDQHRLEAYSGELGACEAGYLRTTPFSDTVFQELISSGKLDRIRDPDLRGKIRDLTTKQAELKDRANGGRDVLRDQNPFVIKYYRYEILADGRSTCRVQWRHLFTDPAAVTAAIRMYRMHELVRQGRRDLLRETEAVRKDVGCALGKPECRNRG